MSKLVRLLLPVVTVSFFVTYAAAKKPAGPGGGGGSGDRQTTDMCQMTGDISSAGEVEVGIVVKGEPRYTALPITLHLSADLLNVGGAEPVAGHGEWIEQLTEGDYYGYARVLKKDGRLDFAFTDGDFDAAVGCRPITYGDLPLPLADGSPVCPYELILAYGVYDRKLDTDYFSPPVVEKHISKYTSDGSGGSYSTTLGGEVTIDFPPYDQ